MLALSSIPMPDDLTHFNPDLAPEEGPGFDQAVLAARVYTHELLARVLDGVTPTDLWMWLSAMETMPRQALRLIAMELATLLESLLREARHYWDGRTLEEVLDAAAAERLISRGQIFNAHWWVAELQWAGTQRLFRGADCLIDTMTVDDAQTLLGTTVMALRALPDPAAALAHDSPHTPAPNPLAPERETVSRPH